MNNTKERFFAQYWGQRVMKNAINGAYFLINQTTFFRIDEKHLELKPLSQISEFDAMQLAKMLNVDQKAIDAGLKKDFADKLAKMLIEEGGTIRMFDFLRFKGYALPWNDMSVEEMVEAGWIRLETKN